MKIVSATKDLVLPEDKFFYIHGSNGTFLSMKTEMVEAIVKAKEVAGLEPVKPSARWLLPAIPAEDFARIALFFNQVAKKHDTEVGVMLHFNFKTGEWRVTVPKQEVTACHVTYQGTDRIPGFRMVGTMHSHVTMSAHHSSVDIQDEGEFDGLHVTIGRVNKYPTVDVDAEIVLRGSKFHFTSGIFAAKVVQGLEVIGQAEQDYEEDEEDEEDRGRYFGRTNWSKNYRPWDVCTHKIKGTQGLVIPQEWWDALTVKSWKSTWGGHGGNYPVY